MSKPASSMQYRDISFPTPEENISFDEALFQLADKHEAGEYLRFWESSSVFIVLGRIGKEEEDVNLAQTKVDGIPVLRRCSGGGTVVQGYGCLNYTLILSKQKHQILNDLRKSYEWISGQIIESLSPLGVEACFKPISDLAILKGEKKFSGNAQRRGKHYILHHGTILYDFDLNLISQYLRMPQDIPEYRQARSHKDFVTNIPIDPKLFKKNLALNFGFPAQPQTVTSQELSALKTFLK